MTVTFIVYGLADDQCDVEATDSLKDLNAHLDACLLFDDVRDARHEAERAAADAKERNFAFDCSVIRYEVSIRRLDEPGTA